MSHTLPTRRWSMLVYSPNGYIYIYIRSYILVFVFIYSSGYGLTLFLFVFYSPACQRVVGRCWSAVLTNLYTCAWSFTCVCIYVLYLPKACLASIIFSFFCFLFSPISQPADTSLVDVGLRFSRYIYTYIRMHLLLCIPCIYPRSVPPIFIFPFPLLFYVPQPANASVVDVGLQP